MLVDPASANYSDVKVAGDVEDKIVKQSFLKYTYVFIDSSKSSSIYVTTLKP